MIKLFNNRLKLSFYNTWNEAGISFLGIDLDIWRWNESIEIDFSLSLFGFLLIVEVVV